MTSDELLSYLDDRGMRAVTYEHTPVYTVDDSQRLRGHIPGVRTKNLLLGGSKKAFFLVVACDTATINLRHLRRILGSRGTLSFGTPDALLKVLGVTPGAVSLLALVNDSERKVSLVIDESLPEAEYVNCHPLIIVEQHLSQWRTFSPFSRRPSVLPCIYPSRKSMRLVT
jgi:Ala-tRNA(Pro) deacylase